MAKATPSTKETKKQPAMTPKEKKAVKIAKKNAPSVESVISHWRVTSLSRSVGSRKYAIQ